MKAWTKQRGECKRSGNFIKCNIRILINAKYDGNFITDAEFYNGPVQICVKHKTNCHSGVCKAERMND